MSEPKKWREWKATFVLGSDDEKCIMSSDQEFIDRMFFKEKINVIETGALDELRAEIAKLREDREELLEALRFYADSSAWSFYVADDGPYKGLLIRPDYSKDLKCCGGTAREAIAKSEERWK